MGRAKWQKLGKMCGEVDGGAGRRDLLDVPGEFIPPALERQVTSRANPLSGITAEAFLWI